MEKKFSKEERPNISTVLWWDWDYEMMDFQKAQVSVVQRILEYGDEEEYEEMVRFYGLELVIKTIKHDIKFMADYAIERACNYFSLKKEEIWCYIDKQSRPNYTI